MSTCSFMYPVESVYSTRAYVHVHMHMTEHASTKLDAMIFRCSAKLAIGDRRRADGVWYEETSSRHAKLTQYFINRPYVYIPCAKQ